MTELNRQQICAALLVSESHIRRLELIGLPYTPVGVRSKRYDLDECKTWLKMNEALVMGKAARPPAVPQSLVDEFRASFMKQRIRVKPS